MITLKEFVKETRRQICDATIEFAVEKRDTGVNANPMLGSSKFVCTARVTTT